jgi:hypothetical protein
MAALFGRPQMDWLLLPLLTPEQPVAGVRFTTVRLAPFLFSVGQAYGCLSTKLLFRGIAVSSIGWAVRELRWRALELSYQALH